MPGRIVLASASPRRRELLTGVGLSFEVRPVEVDEGLSAFTDPEQAGLELAGRKARAAAERALEEAPGERLWIVAADTVVAVPDRAGGGWRLLGKPGGESEARAMLASLSATRHAVTTGVCVLRLPELAGSAAAERTWVTMRRIEPGEIEAYVRSGEWRGKAGGYAIQETADAFVTDLAEGGRDNVVGLPLALTLRLLAELGAEGAGGGLVVPGPGG